MARVRQMTGWRVRVHPNAIEIWAEATVPKFIATHSVEFDQVMWLDPDESDPAEELRIAIGALVLRKKLEIAQIKIDPSYAEFLNHITATQPVVRHLEASNKLRRVTNHHVPGTVPAFEVMGYKQFGIDARNFALLDAIAERFVPHGLDVLLTWWERGAPL